MDVLELVLPNVWEKQITLVKKHMHHSLMQTSLFQEPSFAKKFYKIVSLTQERHQPSNQIAISFITNAQLLILTQHQAALKIK